jgi:transposase
MCNPKITIQNYIIEQTSLPLTIQDETCVSKKGNYAPTFIPYNNQQGISLFDIQDLIPSNHVSRVIDEMIESIEDDVFFSHYKGGGRSSFHPKMMTKVILYGYSKKVYSSRGIENLLSENIPAKWLAAGREPDHRTINRFRSQQLKNMMDSLFEEMIQLLIEQNYITMENYFLDGTKIEADANKYSFVWKKATKNFEGKLKEKIQETIHHIQAVAESELIQSTIKEVKEDVTPEQLEVIAQELEGQVTTLTDAIEAEKDVTVRKEIRSQRSVLKKPLKLIRENFLPRLDKYKQQHEIYGDRNSFSKTDHDATFMRMKE